MRKMLFAATCLAVFAAAPAAFAQEDAPVDTEAAAADADCQRAGGRRGVMAQSRLCRAAADTARAVGGMGRLCEITLTVRAAALRYAGGKRRHVPLSRCA